MISKRSTCTLHMKSDATTVVYSSLRVENVFKAGWLSTLFVFAILHFHCTLVEAFMYSMTDDAHMRKCKYAFCIYEMRDYPEQSHAFYHNTEGISIAVQHNSANNTRSQASI